MFAYCSSSTPSDKGNEILVEDMINVRSDEELEKQEWLHTLLRTRFWTPCEEHWDESRGEMSLFCLHCHEVVCPHCTHDDPGHRLLKVRRYVYRSVVLVRDMQDLCVDVSRIQTYTVNSQKGVHLRPMRRSPQFRPHPGSPRCLTCFCWLRNTPNIFCSLSCKEKANVSQDDFSGPEADRRHRQQTQATVAETSSGQRSPQPSDASALAILVESSCQLSLEPSDASPVTDQHHMPEAEHSNEQAEADVSEMSTHLRPPSPQQHDAPHTLMANQHHPGMCPAARKRPRKQVAPMRAPFF